MREEYGPTFISVTDEDGNEKILELIDVLEHHGCLYEAFFPAEVEGENEDDPDHGLIIMKIIQEDGEDLLSTLDSDEELEEVYELFMQSILEDEDDRAFMESLEDE